MLTSAELGDRARAQVLGKKGHDLYEFVDCPDCGYSRWVIVLKGSVKSRLCRRCGMVKALGHRKGPTHQAWKSGRLKNNGYVRVYVADDHPMASMRTRSNAYLLEHRLVMAMHLGRPLQRQEIVHHKDGNRSNNNISNLELTTLGAHAVEHSKGYERGFEKGYQDGLKAALAAITGGTQQ
jgi:hypothetical protein